MYLVSLTISIRRVRYAKLNKAGPELGRKFNFQVSQEVSCIVE